MIQRTFLTMLLAVALLMPCLGATAETEALPVGQIVELTDGQTIDLDGDGVAEQIGFTTVEKDDISQYSLSVGDSKVSDTGMYLSGRLHAVRMGEYDSYALLFVSDYGMSDDPTSYIYAYQGGQLRKLNTIDAVPWEMRVTGGNTFAGLIRGRILQTWRHPCVFVLSTGFFEEDDMYVIRPMSINEMPLSEYPMGTYVTVTKDVELQLSPTNDRIVYTLKAGSGAVIVSTDDVEWLYIERVQTDEQTEYSEYIGGWLKVSDGGNIATIAGEEVMTSELFTGLLFAD